jgi:hypothetical protein
MQGDSPTTESDFAGFGDRVRIRASSETVAAGVAGLEGEIYGFTTPSTTGVQVIGGAPDDYALNVSLESTDATLWVRPDLVELLHHNAGVEVVVGNMKLIRQTDGSWIEEPPTTSTPINGAEAESNFFETLVNAFKSRRKRDA